MRLTSLDFIRNKQNIILAGNPRTCKTHLSIDLGIKALVGFNVYFAHVPNLIIELKEAENITHHKTQTRKLRLSNIR